MNFLENFVIIVFLLQSFLMFFDEFYFHWKRGLPKFERIGHPIDTFFVLLCYSTIAFLNFNHQNSLIYFLLSLISCICVIKDEAIHKKHCPPKEQFLHASLFLLHPVILTSIFLCWPSINHNTFSMFSFQSIFLSRFFYLQFTLSFCFFLYQIIYWNFILKGTSHETAGNCQ